MKRKAMGSLGVVVLCVSLAASQGLAQGDQGASAGASPSSPGSAAPAPTGSAAAPDGSASAPDSVVPAPPAVPPLAEALTGEAKSEYESGKMLYGASDFGGALMKFRRAHEVSGDGRLLWNMAVCEKNLRHYVSVLQLVGRYRAEAGALLSDQDRKEAEDLANAVQAFVSNVHIKVNEPGAVVTIDDAPVGESPLPGPVLVDMGPRRLKVTKAGFKPYTYTEQIPGTSEVYLAVTLLPDVHEGRLLVVAGAGHTIWIDGKPSGNERWEGRLTSGGHTLKVTGRGKKTYQSEVTILDDQTRELRVTLEPDTPPPTASNTWMWIAGGVAVGAGLAVGGYFLLRPEDEPAPEPVVGSMSPGTVTLPLMRFGR